MDNGYLKFFDDAMMYMQCACEPPKNLVEVANYILDNLIDKPYSDAIGYKYGINGKPKLNYTATGKMLNVSGQVAKHKWLHGMRDIRLNSNAIRLLSGSVSIKEYESKAGIQDIEVEIGLPDTLEDFLEMRWSDAFNFPVRMYNSLYRHHYATVRDLVSATNEELLEVNGIGGYALQEIHRKTNNALKKYGTTRKDYLISIGKAMSDVPMNIHTSKKSFVLKKEQFTDEEWKVIQKALEFPEDSNMITFYTTLKAFK